MLVIEHGEVGGRTWACLSPAFVAPPPRSACLADARSGRVGLFRGTSSPASGRGTTSSLGRGRLLRLQTDPETSSSVSDGSRHRISSNSLTLWISVPMEMLVTRSRMNSSTTGT